MGKALRAMWLSLILLSVPAFGGQALDPQARYETFQETLASDAYSDQKTHSEWKPKNPKPKKETDFSKYQELFDFLEKVSQKLGLIGKAVLVLLLLMFFFWLYKNKDRFANLLTAPIKQKPAKITPDFRPDVWLDELPDKDDIASLVKACIERGDLLGALSLLYKDSLRSMSERHQMAIGRGRTEEECQWLLAVAKTAQRDERTFFEQLVKAWQKTAYGKSTHGVGRDDVLGLLKAWQTVWGER